MDPAHVARHAPGAVRMGTAVLPGFGIRIVGKGYGDLVAEPGSAVHGVLWDLSPGDEAALDEFEGVPAGWYRKEHQTVRDAAGREVRAMLYRAVDTRPGVPVPGYLENIIESATSLQFPVDYVESLRRLLSAGGDR